MSVTIRNLMHVYGSGDTAVSALQGLDLEVQDGEICIVRGPNGSGKSTLIGALTGALAPTAGEVRISSGSGPKPKVAVLRQFESLMPELTVREHFSLLAGTDDLTFVDEAIIDLRVAALSAGQRQLVAIALALVTPFDVMLADEPTGALQEADAEHAYSLLARVIRERGSSLLLVTHDARAERIADHVVRLQDGRISERWKPGCEPQQVIDSRGWLRVPDDVRDGWLPLLQIQATDAGAHVIAERSLQTTAEPRTQRETAPGGEISIDAFSLGLDGGRVISLREMHIPPHGFTSLTGSPGSGKTQLLRALAQHFSGRSDLDSEPRTASYFSADLPFASELSCRELLIPDELLSALQLEDLADRPLRTLSGGQRQRAIVAAALAHPCDLLLLDDPTSSLDDDSAARVINALRDSQRAVMVASHDVRVVNASNAVVQVEA